MSRPKISIITITYNSEKTLEETIKSIVSQNYSNLEYIIIDGGSKDRTLEIVEKYRDEISVIVSEPDNGISDAFNKGIRHATGEIIGIINSDDILMPGALDAISSNYDPSVDVYSGNLLFWDDKTGGTIRTLPEMKFDKLKLQYGVAHPSRFVSRNAYEKYGTYAIDLKYKMDIDLLVRFYKAGAKFKYVNKDLAKFRLGGTTNDSLSKKKYDFEQFVLRNGWTKFDFYLLWLKAWSKHVSKKIIYFVLGDDARFILSKFRVR